MAAQRVSTQGASSMVCVCVCVGTNGLRAQGAAWQWSRHTVNKLHGALRPSEGHCKLSEVMAELRLAQPP